ncbi:MAG: MBL fold metallo-hydrolase [Chloroflexota bacterium]|nr:MBL fold metallo-hydrolase [Chloroflexota bacterium]
MEWEEGAGSATRLEEGVWLIDLGFQDRPEIVAAYLLAGAGEVVLIETGPSSTLPSLLAGITAAGFAPEELTGLLVTHIHLDHAGAAGVLIRLFPHLTVGVHPVGAAHLIDPSRLLASATRIYQERMESLWGEVAPIPAQRVVPLADGRVLPVAGRSLEVIHTPGHASHHVAFFDPEARSLFTGDVGGVRIPGTDYVCPPTPPPDLDPASWKQSVARLRALDAQRLYLTHFGAFDDVAEHLDQLIPNLTEFVAVGRASFATGDDQTELTAQLHARMGAALGDAPPEALERLEWATPSYMAALGLTRLVSREQRTISPPSPIIGRGGLGDEGC